MRTCGIILAILLLSAAAIAQEKTGYDSVQTKIVSKIKELKEITPADSLKPDAQKADSLKSLGQSKADSLRNVSNLPGEKLNGLQIKATSKLDSIKNLVALPAINLPVSDSLKQPDLSVVEQKLNGVSNKAQQKADTLGQKVATGVDKAAQAVETKIQDITKENVSLPEGKLPSVPDVAVPGIENMPTPGSNNSVPGIAPPDVNVKIPNTDLPATDIEGLKEKKPDQSLPEIPAVEEFKMPDEVSKAQENLGKAGEELNKAGKHAEDLKELKAEGVIESEKLPDAAEQQAEKVAETQGVKKEIGAVTAKQKEYEAMIERYKNKKLVQEEMKRKMSNVVNDKINQHSPAFKEAQNGFAKSKKLHNEAGSLSTAMKKKRINTLKDKTFGQRLVPGVSFQAYNRTVYTMDWGVHAGYRFTSRLTAGLGGTYRTGFSESYDSFVRGLDVYGGRVYGDLLIKKGFFAHGELEGLWLGAYSLTGAPNPDNPVWASNFGIGKQYNIRKRLRGNILALYRFELNSRLPGQSKINLRAGFELKNKRKRK